MPNPCSRVLRRVLKSNFKRDSYAAKYFYFLTGRVTNGNKMAEVEWTNDLVIRLINEYKQRPELWDPQHDSYRVATAKYEAWSELAISFECDIADLRKKLNSVFASHRREKGKVRCGGRSTWFLYKYLSFLPNHLEASDDATIHIPTTAEVKQPCEESGQSSENEYENGHDDEIVIKQEPIENYHKRMKPHSKPRLTKPIRRRVMDRVSSSHASKLDSRLLETLRILRRSDLSRKKDECDSFGEYIADSLRKHDDKTQSMIKQAINNILFEQEMKKYNVNQYTVVINDIDENPLQLDHVDSKC